MTRRSITIVLGSLLVGLLLVNAPAVSASGCATGYAPEHCEAKLATQDAAQFSAVTVHVLAGSGIGQEQFEAAEDTGNGQFVIAVPTDVTGMHVESGYAPENYAQIASTIPTN